MNNSTSIFTLLLEKINGDVEACIDKNKKLMLVTMKFLNANGFDMSDHKHVLEATVSEIQKQDRFLQDEKSFLKDFFTKLISDGFGDIKPDHEQHLLFLRFIFYLYKDEFKKMRHLKNTEELLSFNTKYFTNMVNKKTCLPLIINYIGNDIEKYQRVVEIISVKVRQIEMVYHYD